MKKDLTRKKKRQYTMGDSAISIVPLEHHPCCPWSPLFKVTHQLAEPSKTLRKSSSGKRRRAVAGRPR